MITEKELNPHGYALSPEQQENFKKLYTALNEFRKQYGKPMVVTSGVRSPEDQKRINPKALGSAHVKAAAADFADTDGALDRYCLDNLSLLEKLGLYLEDPSKTPRWTHLQIIPPRSGNRVFLP